MDKNRYKDVLPCKLLWLCVCPLLLFIPSTWCTQPLHFQICAAFLTFIWSCGTSWNLIVLACGASTALLWPSCSSFRWFYQGGAPGPGGLHQRQPHHGAHLWCVNCVLCPCLTLNVNSSSMWCVCVHLRLCLRWRPQCPVFVYVMLRLRVHCHRPVLTFGRLFGSSRYTPSSC